MSDPTNAYKAVGELELELMEVCPYKITEIHSKAADVRHALVDYERVFECLKECHGLLKTYAGHVEDGIVNVVLAKAEAVIKEVG